MLGIGTIAKKVFGTPNDRKIKATRPLVARINALEPEFEKLSDDEIKLRTEELAKRADAGEDLDDLLPELRGSADRLHGLLWRDIAADEKQTLQQTLERVSENLDQLRAEAE